MPFIVGCTRGCVQQWGCCGCWGMGLKGVLGRAGLSPKQK